MSDSQKPDEHFSRAELRYRIADSINDRLRAIPYFHSTLKRAANWLQYRRDLRLIKAASKSAPARSAAAGSNLVQPNGELPLPPIEMRRLVGPFDPESYDNPDGDLVYPWLAKETYETVFDFGCGCGRVARQLILQRPCPTSYVGVDLHAEASRLIKCNSGTVTGQMSEVESYSGMFRAAISFNSIAVLSEYGSISGDGIYEHILAFALRAFNYFLYGVPHIQFIEVLLGFR